MLSSDDLASRLHEHVERFGVVGAAAAVWHDGDLVQAATGTASLRTGQPVLPDSEFLIGSTTKLYTTTLVMQLAAEGVLDLDAPIDAALPGIRLGGAEGSLTLRLLLSQTSGLDNGPYTDFGGGDDAVARYVESLADIPPVAPAGERYGYSNVNFVIAGLAVERATGQPWDDVVRERILDPGGLTHTHTRAEEALLHPVAIGHHAVAVAEPRPVDRWGVCGRAMGPTGSTLCASAADLARFGALHLGEGDVIDDASAKAMRELHVRLLEGAVGSFGNALCWRYDEWDSVVSVAHAGANLGAGSFLRVFPDQRTSIAIVFNSDNAAVMQRTFVNAVAADLLGVNAPDPWLTVGAVPTLDLSLYEGTYARHGFRARVVVDGDELVFSEASMEGYRLDGLRLRPATATHFGSQLANGPAARLSEGALYPDYSFDGFDEAGHPQYLYTWPFLSRRTS